MGSPVLRSMQQQQQQQIPCTTSMENNPQFGGMQSGGGMLNLGNGQPLMGFGGPGRNAGMTVGGLSSLPNNPSFGMGGMGHDMGSGLASQGSANSMMYGNTRYANHLHA